MRLRRKNNLLVEPPATATGDIAFILIVFFLVCASVQPDGGRRQDVPKSENKDQPKEQTQNIEVAVNRSPVVNINGTAMAGDKVTAYLKNLLAAKLKPEDRIVVLKAAKDTPYAWWTNVVFWIEEAGGVVTIQREEERTVLTN